MERLFTSANLNLTATGISTTNTRFLTLDVGDDVEELALTPVNIVNNVGTSIDTAIARFSGNTGKVIQNSGITAFGKYQEIMDGLIYYYDNSLPYLNKLTATYDDQVTKEDEFWRYEQNTYEFNYLDGLKSYQNDKEAKRKLIKLLKSPTARNILKIDMRRNLFLEERLSYVLPKLKKMILELEKSLN